MNIYLDLEATQKTKEIISIGAVKETGETFYSLVKPKNINNITPFIENLTGLSKMMYLDPSLFEISTNIRRFWRWCKGELKTADEVHIFVYGGFDLTLLMEEYKRNNGVKEFKSVLKRTNDLAIAANKVIFGNNEVIGVLKTIEKLTGEEYIQTHNSLDDAYLLQEIHKYIRNTPIDYFKEYEEDYYTKKYIKIFKKHRMKHNKLRNFLSSFCDLELEGLHYSDIGQIIGFDHVEKAIIADYKSLTGEIYKGRIYE